jgi:predicted lipid carrier protein YhbT
MDREMSGHSSTWPAPLQALQRAAATAVSRLPPHPSAWLAARLLDRVLLPRLPADARAALAGACVELRVIDLGLRVRLRLGPRGFEAAPWQGEAALRIRAPAASYARLGRGEDDPERLFFERALVMEGDSELGLVLKNTLDAIGPLWPRRHPG